MPKYVQVGEDVVEFPDGMTDAQIAQALSPPSTATPPSSGFRMGLKDPITAGAQMLPRALAGVTSGFGTVPNPVSRFFSSEAQRVDEMARAEEDAYQQQRQAQGGEGFDFSRLAGNILNPASIAVGTRAAQLARARGAGTLTQASAAGVAGAATQPAIGEGTFGEQKTEQAVIGAIGGPVGQKVVAGAGRVLNPLVSKAEQTMRDLGIRPTTGQVLGGQFKNIEDFAQNLPLVGSAITNARQRTLFDFNKGVINDALRKIGQKLPADVVGRDAIAHASQVVSNNYDDVLARMKFSVDQNTRNRIINSAFGTGNLSTQQGDAVEAALDGIVFSKFAGRSVAPGAEFKGIESDLRKKASDYLNSATASEREIGRALSDALGQMKKELRSQNPSLTPRLRRIDNAYGKLSVVNIAAANSGAENGVFTPTQFSQAVRQADVTRKKSAFAKGKAKSQTISDAAVDVLGDEAKSTLEGRILASAAGGYGLLSQPQFAIPAAALTPAMYSRTGQALVDAALRSRPGVVRQLGGLLSGVSPQAGAVTLPNILNEYNRSERRLVAP
jgi:hypothetical protein